MVEIDVLIHLIYKLAHLVTFLEREGKALPFASYYIKPFTWNNPLL